MKTASLRTLMIFAGLAVFLSACGEPPPVEAQIRAWVATAEKSAEARNLGKLKDLVADDYADADGHARQDVINLMRLYLLRNKSINMLTRIRDIEVLAEDRVHLVVAVGMSGQPVDQPERLLDVRGRILLLNLDLIGDGDDWRVVSARWQDAGPSALLPGT